MPATKVFLGLVGDLKEFSVDLYPTEKLGLLLRPGPQYPVVKEVVPPSEAAAYSRAYLNPLRVVIPGDLLTKINGQDCFGGRFEETMQILSRLEPGKPSVLHFRSGLGEASSSALRAPLILSEGERQQSRVVRDAHEQRQPEHQEEESNPFL